MQNLDNFEIEGDSKSSLKEFIDTYKTQFEEYKDYLLSDENLFGQVNRQEFYLQRDMVAIILDRLKFLKTQFGAYLDLKYVKEFAELMEFASESFVQNCENYMKVNKWQNMEDVSKKSKEIKFQGDVLSVVAKFRDSISKYGLDSDNEVLDVSLPIEGDKKVPLMMQENIKKTFSQVEEYEKVNNFSQYHTSYDLDNSAQMFKNIKNPPPYDRHKNFWEQGKDTIDFYLEEKDKIVNGITIGGVKLSGFLYWHANFYKISMPPEALKGRPEYDASQKAIIATPNLRDNELYFDYFYRKAEEEGKGLFIFGTRRFAKALHNEELLVYSDGSLRPIGEAQVGDEIIGRDGKKTRIQGVFPQGEKDLYKITFTDGRTIRCCPDHLWTFDIGKNREERVTIPMSELINNFEKKDFYLPDVDIVRYWNTKTTTFDPYLLAAWSFCGTPLNRGVGFNLSGYSDKWSNIKHSCKAFDYKYVEDIDNMCIYIDDRGASSNVLTGMNLDVQRAVPDEVYAWTVRDKIQYLRGIMDFAKTSDRGKGLIDIYGMNNVFRDGIERLIRELGLQVTSKRGVLTIHKVQYNALGYKGYSEPKKVITSKVESIEKIDRGEATCIKVDNDESLFLTTGFIPTHNTTIEGSILTRYSTVFSGSKNLVIGGADGDLANLSDVLETAFLNVNPAFFLPRNNNDWKKHIQFGLKHKSGERIPHSDIFIRNVNSGKAGGELKVAGATPDSWIVDEVGKFEISPVYEQARPSFDTPYGMRLVPILVGCLTKDNWLFDRQGRPVKIEDMLSRENAEVSGWNGRCCSVEPVTHRNPVVKKKCVKITFENGLDVSCSTDHPFMKLYNEIYKYRNNAHSNGTIRAKQAKELEVGDSIMFPDRMSFHNRTIRNFFEGDEEPQIVEGVMNVAANNNTFGDKLLASCDRVIKKLFQRLFQLNGEATFYGKDIYSWSFPNINLSREAIWMLMKIGIHCRLKDGGTKIETLSKVDAHRTRIFILEGTGLIDESLCFDTDDYANSHEKMRKTNYYFDYDKKNGKGEHYTSLVRNSIKNVRPIKIVKIEDIGKQRVYNFTAGFTHTYIANGAITFNTGGNAKFSASAQDMLTNPDAYKLLNMDWDYLDKMIGGDIDIPYKRRSFGIFVPAHLSYKEGLLKDKSNLSEYFGIDDNRLKNIEIEVTNWKRAEKVINDDRESKKKVRETLNQEKMSYPIDPLECFLATTNSPFTCISEAIALRDRLRADGDIGEYVELYKSPEGSIKSRPSDKQVPDFPFKGGNIASPIVLFDRYPEVASFNGTYTAGLDHYKHDKSGTDSVGSLYVFKRKININDPWANRFVCSYAARPDTMKEFNRNCELVLDAYGAQVLQENADISFQQYLSEKSREDFLLARGEDIINTLMRPNSGSMQNNKFGLNPSKQNKDYLMKLFASYCNANLDEEEQEYFGITRGVERIADPYLLDEIIGFSYGVNVDRITSAAHALAWGRYLDKIGLIPDEDAHKNADENRKRKAELRAKMRNSYRGVNASIKRKAMRNKRNKAKSILD